MQSAYCLALRIFQTQLTNRHTQPPFFSEDVLEATLLPSWPSNSLRPSQTPGWSVILQVPSGIRLNISIFFCEHVFMVSVKDKMGSGSNGSLVQPAKCSEGQVGEKKQPILFSCFKGHRTARITVRASDRKQKGKGKE